MLTLNQLLRAGERLVPLTLLLGLLAFPARGYSNAFDVYGAGSRNTAMGRAGVAAADDATAVYYNPAAMFLGDSAISGGFLFTFNRMQINRSRVPDGYGIPSLGAAAPVIGDDFMLRPPALQEELGPSYAAWVGGMTNLGSDKLRVGALVYLPIGNSATQSSVYNDERERLFSNRLNWELMGGRVEQLILQFGVAYKPVSWFAIGAGASYLPLATTNNRVYVDNVANMSEIDINVELTLGTSLRPNVGVMIMPTENIQFGLAFRDRHMLRLLGNNEIQVRGFEGTADYPFNQPLNLVMNYTPRQIVAGGSWRVGDVLLVGDVTYALWSAYLNHHDEKQNFEDVFMPRIGVEWEVIEDHVVRGGLGWEPTPVGPQTGRTNFVDNNRIVASLGSGHTLDVRGHRLTLNWHAQVHFLLSRTELKDALDTYPACTPGVRSICDEIADSALNPQTGTPWPEGQGLQTGNPGFPGWTSGGWLTNIGFDASWQW